MNRDQKASMVSDLNESFSRAKFAVVTDYRGLKVTELEKLRRNLRQCDARFRIAKNTLLRLAVKGTGCEPLTESLTGTTAVAIGFDDPVASAKALFEFAKEYKALNIRSAVLDGSVLSVDDVEALSMLPGKDVLLAKLLGTMAAVPTGLVRVLNAVPQSFVYALQAIKEQKEN
ncbi:MAG TPA: 50S ribosomal protein L10 [Desulfobacteraceae bacterium]|nr:50S ribosomal protein L10 [Desulfobacteraceae bacterium]